MSTTALLTRRLGRVQTVHNEQAVQRCLAETAQKLSLDPGALTAEYQRLVLRMQTIGAVTPAAQLRVLAEELSMDVEELEAELAAMEAEQA